MALYGDLASHARTRARQLSVDTDAANYYRQPPEDPTDVVAMAQHRAQLKKDQRARERAAVGRRIGPDRIYPPGQQEPTPGPRPAWWPGGEQHRAMIERQDASLRVPPASTQFQPAYHAEPHGLHDVSPGDMARQMLQQRQQDAEMGEWQKIFNDRRPGRGR